MYIEMRFKINNTEWEIIEKQNLDNEKGTGYTDDANRKIILRRQGKAYMINTLKRELAHVWLYENQNEEWFTNKEVCDVVARSNDFINEVVGQYIQDIQEQK